MINRHVIENQANHEYLFSLERKLGRRNYEQTYELLVAMAYVGALPDHYVL
jgi:hypothetical protein